MSSALRQQAAAFESRTGILVMVSALPAPDNLPPKTKDTLVRICQEALTNVAKHADANTVRLTLERQLHRTVLSIEDDGRGFDIAAAGERSAQAGSGLPIMRERALAVGARLRIRSAPGAGTRVEVLIADKEG